MKILSYITGQRFAQWTLMALLLVSVGACSKSQIGGFMTTSISETPKCGATDKLLTFKNPNDETLFVRGIALSAGSNGEGHFSLPMVTVSDGTVVEPFSSGGIGEFSIPANETYTIVLRYSPFSNTADGEVHTTILDIVYQAPDQGVFQVVVDATSQGEDNCPEQAVGVEVGLDGPVELTITRLLAASGQIPDKLDSEAGQTPFEEVFLNASLDAGDGTDGTISFPEIKAADGFILPPPLQSKSPTLFSLVKSDAVITTRDPVLGSYDASRGFLLITGVQVDLVIGPPKESELNLTVDLTTEAVSFDGFLAPVTPINAGFLVIGDSIVGLPIQEDGTVILVGLAAVDRATGALDAAFGKMLVQIEAIITCPGGGTNCVIP